MCREEERCKDEKEGNYTALSKRPHLAELRVCDGEEWLNSKEVLLPFLAPNHLTCASQAQSLSVTQDLILRCLGSWFS